MAPLVRSGAAARNQGRRWAKPGGGHRAPKSRVESSVRTLYANVVGLAEMKDATAIRNSVA